MLLVDSPKLNEIGLEACVTPHYAETPWIIRTFWQNDRQIIETKQGNKFNWRHHYDDLESIEHNTSNVREKVCRKIRIKSLAIEILVAPHLLPMLVTVRNECLILLYRLFWLIVKGHRNIEKDIDVMAMICRVIIAITSNWRSIQK